jgi:hypothetical protein
MMTLKTPPDKNSVDYRSREKRCKAHRKMKLPRKDNLLFAAGQPPPRYAVPPDPPATTMAG